MISVESYIFFYSIKIIKIRRQNSKPTTLYSYIFHCCFFLLYDQENLEPYIRLVYDGQIVFQRSKPYLKIEIFFLI
jgi:hypothetical protein